VFPALQVLAIGSARYLYVLKELPKNARCVSHARKPPQAAPPLSPLPSELPKPPRASQIFACYVWRQKVLQKIEACLHIFSNYKNLYFRKTPTLVLALRLKLILNHQESCCTENHNTAPKNRSSKNESIYTIRFLQQILMTLPEYSNNYKKISFF
jgi:hypothetical protein